MINHLPASKALLDSPGTPRSAAASAAPPLELRCSAGMEGLTELHSHWDFLVTLLPDARFHHQYAWYLSYLRNLEPDVAAVRFFAFFREGRPVAIVPLRRVVQRVAGLPLRVWELPFHPHMSLGDVLISRHEDGAAIFAELLRQIGNHGRQWDAVHLPNLLDDSQGLAALRQSARPKRLVCRGQSMYFLTDNLEVALRNTTAQFRRNLRRQRRKLEQSGHVQSVLLRDPESLNAAYDDFLRIEGSGWKSDVGSAIAQHPRLTAFYSDLIRYFGAEQRCLIALLRLDGKAIATMFCLTVGLRHNLLKIGYDEAYAAGAPGNLLLHDVLGEMCAAQAIKELSLVTGPTWAVGRWNPETRDVWDGLVFNTTPRGLAAHALLRLRAVAAAAKCQLARWQKPPATVSVPVPDNDIPSLTEASR